MKKFLALGVVALGLAACATEQENRALTGGALGAGAGAIIGGLATGTGGGALAGAAIGGAGGAIVGASTAPRTCRGYDRYGRPVAYRC